MKLLIVYNSSAGPGDGAIYDYIRMVVQDGDEICLRCTDGTTDAAALLSDARSFDAVVTAGGDGTISRIAHALAYTGIPILPFPAGTGNLIANNLSIPFEPPALAAITREMRTLDFDLGEIEAGGKRFGFSVMAGAGFDASLMATAQPAKKVLGPMAYFSAALANIRPKKAHIHLDVDGQTIERDGVGILFVNFSKMQFDVTVIHDNEPRDGTFDIVILKAKSAIGLIPALIAGILDRDGGFPSRTNSLEVLRASQATAWADPPLQIQFDGETPPIETPISAHMLKGAARFILPEDAYAEFSRN